MAVVLTFQNYERIFRSGLKKKTNIFSFLTIIAMLLSCHALDTKNSTPMKSWKIISHRSESPWAGFTSSWEEEEKSRIVQSDKPNNNYIEIIQYKEFLFENIPILFQSNKERKVIVDNEYFSDLNRIDATKLNKLERGIIGKAKNPKVLQPEFLLPFLIRSQIIQTLIHTDSELEFIREEDKGNEKWFYFQGEHHYYTNSKNTSLLNFIVTIDYFTQEISIIGE